MSRKAIWLIASGAVLVLFLLWVVGTFSASTPTPPVALSSSSSIASPTSAATRSASPRVSTTPTTGTQAQEFLGMLTELPEDNSPANHTGYNREYFRAWIDADSDGCNTRAEVLMAESQSQTSHRGTCTIETGIWISSYDGLTLTSASQLDIDHFVPLKEAWISGAYSWNAATLVSYGNDLGYSESLLAVSAHANRSKGDQDPSQWLPSAQSYLCNYSATWVAVKWRWNLSVDALERQTLSTILNGCSDISISQPERALIVLGSPASQPFPENDGVLDPNYGTCGSARANGKGPYIQGIDPEYDWYRDRDKDGIVCE